MKLPADSADESPQSPLARGDLAFLLAFLLFAASLVAFDSGVAPAGRPRPLGADRVLSAGWYCPTPPQAQSESVMSSANLGSRRVRLRTQAIGGSAESASVSLDLQPGRRSSGSIAQFQLPEALGLTEAFGSSIATDLQVLSSAHGASVEACASRPGNRWFFANGSTERRRDNYLLVANPFSEEAVISVKIFGPDKQVEPSLLKEKVVPPLSQTSLFLAEFVPEIPQFGIAVAASQGRVVVSRYSEVATKDGIKGASLELGAETLSPSWFFAGGESPTEGEELLMIVNPDSREALVDLSFQTDKDETSPEKLGELAVPAGRQVAIKTTDYLPRGTKHSTRITSTNGVNVVVERQISASKGARQGFESMLGVPMPAGRWAIPVGSKALGPTLLSVLNPSRKVATIGVSILSEGEVSRPEPLSAISVAPNRAQSIDLSPYLTGPATAVVSAIGCPVVAESTLSFGPPFSDFASSSGTSFGGTSPARAPGATASPPVRPLRRGRSSMGC